MRPLRRRWRKDLLASGDSYWGLILTAVCILDVVAPPISSGSLHPALDISCDNKKKKKATHAKFRYARYRPRTIYSFYYFFCIREKSTKYFVSYQISASFTAGNRTFATKTISSRDGVISPESPTTSTLSSTAFARMWSHGCMTPKSYTWTHRRRKPQTARTETSTRHPQKKKKRGGGRGARETNHLP